MQGRVSMAEAARLLGVNKSTIKRWCDKHPALKDAVGLVDVGEMREHRDQVANPLLQTRGPAAGEAPSREAAPRGELMGHRARSERAKAEEAELDLAARLSLTLERGRVEAALDDAGVVLRRTAAASIRAHAERMVRIRDVREMELVLERLVDEAILAAVTEAQRLIGQNENAGADAA